MNESQGALAPAAVALMKLPSFEGLAPSPTPSWALLIGSLSNQPVCTPVDEFLSVDMLVLKLNEMLRPSPSASETSRQSIWSLCEPWPGKLGPVPFTAAEPMALSPLLPWYWSSEALSGSPVPPLCVASTADRSPCERRPIHAEAVEPAPPTSVADHFGSWTLVPGMESPPAIAALPRSRCQRPVTPKVRLGEPWLMT